MLGADYLGGWTFALVLAGAALAATVELFRALHRSGYRPAPLVALPAVLALVLSPALRQPTQQVWIAIIAATVLLTGILYLTPSRFGTALVGFSLTLLPVLYVGLFMGYLALLRLGPRGAWWVLLVLVITWAYDTGAYFTGRAVGRTPFMSHVSPKKTAEGVVGGLVLSAAAGLIAIPTVHVTVVLGIGLGLVLGVAAQAGDLVESLLKRQLDVKDVGSLIPGHGGVLDRIDSLLFTGVVAYYAAVLSSHAA